MPFGVPFQTRLESRKTYCADVRRGLMPFGVPFQTRLESRKTYGARGRVFAREPEPHRQTGQHPRGDARFGNNGAWRIRSGALTTTLALVITVAWCLEATLDALRPAALGGALSPRDVVAALRVTTIASIDFARVGLDRGRELRRSEPEVAARRRGKSGEARSRVIGSDARTGRAVTALDCDDRAVDDLAQQQLVVDSYS